MARPAGSRPVSSRDARWRTPPARRLGENGFACSRRMHDARFRQLNVDRNELRRLELDRPVGSGELRAIGQDLRVEPACDRDGVHDDGEERESERRTAPPDVSVFTHARLDTVRRLEVPARYWDWMFPDVSVASTDATTAPVALANRDRERHHEPRPGSPASVARASNV